MLTVDHSYMEHHLMDYVLFQMQQGYAEQDIRQALLNYGYPATVVHEVFTNVDTNMTAPFHRRKKQYSPEDLSKDMYEYLLSLLIDYISKEQEQGYHIPAIRKALMKYGHNEKIIDDAIHAIQSGRVVSYAFPKPFQFPQNGVFACCLILMFTVLVFLSIATNTSIATVLLSFSPALVGFIIIHLVLTLLMHRRLMYLLPLLSIVVTVVLFLGSLRLVTLFQYSQPQVVLMLNVLLGFIATLFLCFFSKPKESIVIKVAERAKEEKTEEHLKQNHEMRSESDAPLGDLIREEIQRIDQPQQGWQAQHPQKKQKKKESRKEPKIPLKDIP